MPAGLLNGLDSRQQFLDLIRYLREIADGGPERARALAPDPSQIAGLKLPDYERNIDHAGMIADLGPESLKRGRSHLQPRLRQLPRHQGQPGFAADVVAVCLGPVQERQRPVQPLSDPHPRLRPDAAADLDGAVAEVRRDPLHSRDVSSRTTTRRSTPRSIGPTSTGSRKARRADPSLRRSSPGRRWTTARRLTATYEVATTDRTSPTRGSPSAWTPGPGGVSRGRYWSVFDHDTMRLAAAWTGEGFIDWNGINFNGRHEIHPRIVGLVEVANPIGPGWANPVTGSFDDPRLRGRDGRPYGPLPASWSHFRGQYRHGDGHPVVHRRQNGRFSRCRASKRRARLPSSRGHSPSGRAIERMVLQVARRPGPKAGSARILAPGTAPTGTRRPARAGTVAPSRSLHRATILGSTETLMSRSPGTKDFDMARGDYTIAARFQTRRGGTLFSEDVAWTDKWVPDGKSLFVRDGRLGLRHRLGRSGRVRAHGSMTAEWHEAVLTYADRRTGRVRLFIDGRRDAGGGWPRKALRQAGPP